MERLKPHLQLAETLGLVISQLAGGQVEGWRCVFRVNSPSIPPSLW